MDARELEVRCAGCGAGFAVGTRRCISCGQELGSRPGSSLLLAPGVPDADEPDTQNTWLMNLLSALVMLALVTASALLRACGNES